MADLASQPADLADDSPEASATSASDSASEDISATASEAGANERLIPGAVAIASGELPSADLLGELARAMHHAATSQYERMNAELEKRRVEQVETIAVRSAAEVERLKAGSESDMESIEAWAKAETEKIRLERTRRIEGRRDQLATELGRQDTVRGREVAAVDAAIDGYRTEIDRFFGRMEREHDPAAIAKVAATMPTVPPLAQIADDARRTAIAEFAELEATTEANLAVDAAEATAATAEEPDATTTATEATAEPEVAPEAAQIDEDAPLKGVMDPAATRSGTDPSREWEQPAAVSVAAGSPRSEGHEETPARVGSSLLRTVRAIRPMSDHKERDS